MTRSRYVCQGANSYGQLGHGDAEDRPAPRLCDTAALKDRAVRVVTGGGGHTAVVTGKLQFYRLVLFSRIHNFNRDQWINIQSGGQPVWSMTEPLAPSSGQKIMCHYLCKFLKVQNFACNPV